MRKYEAPQAQVISFDNDYVVAKNQNKSWSVSKACDYVKDSGETVSDR